LAKGATGTRDAGHDCAHGNVKDESEVFVLDLFDVTEKQDFAELWWELLQRCVENGLVIEADENVFGGGACAGDVDGGGIVFEKDGT
jgi:hypothetical protein